MQERLNQENSKRKERKQAKLPDYTVGTIHTMQGKEAAIVIFILGGSSDGAKNWAASKPNLLNVAVTRAKNYLFIIGDKEKWGKLGYFDKAAGLLDQWQTADNPAAPAVHRPPDASDR